LFRAIKPATVGWCSYMQEAAILLGLRVHSAVSNHENQKRQPNLRTAFAYQLIFRATADELFPTLFLEVRSELCPCSKIASHDWSKNVSGFAQASVTANR